MLFLYLQDMVREKLSVFKLLESLSKSRQRRPRERQQTKGLLSRTIAVHVHYEFCTFLCLPLQTAVKWPSSAWSSEHGGRRLIFRISI